MAVPYTFGTATAAIPLSQLDSNFATAITLGNTAVYLGNTTTSLGNVTLTNVTISSGNVTVSNITANAITSPAATSLLLQSAGTTAVTVDTSQNVGIGVAPTYKFDVNGSIRTNNVMYVLGGDGSVQRSGGNTWIIVSSNTGYGSNGVHLKLDSSTTAGFFGFYSQGTSILEAAGAGNTVVLQGGSTSAGTGIAFPATQNASANANTLDDYEEGTWTPSLGGNTTYTQQAGTYKKVGALVYVSGVLQINVLGTGSASQMSGFPFAGTAGPRNTISLSYWSGTVGALVYLAFYLPSSGTTSNTIATTAAASGVQDGYGVFQSGTYVIFSGCYHAS